MLECRNNKSISSNSRAKILLLITHDGIGGAQKHIHSLVRGLASSHSIVLCYLGNESLIDDSSSSAVKTYYLSELNDKNYFLVLLAVIKLVKAEQPDLIHVHSAVASLLGRMAGRLAGVKTLYTVHGWHFVVNTVFWRRYAGWVVELIARPFTSGWIVVSKFDLRVGVKCGVINKRRACFIPNGVEDLGGVAQKSLKSQKNGLSLVFVGRSSYQKNCLEAIDVLESCVESVRLTMYVTSGEHLQALKERIEKSAAKQRISLICDDFRASSALHEHDAMLLTSRYEGMPLCVLEAMRAGLAVVATDVCGMNEVVEHGRTGYLYQLGDVNGAVNWIDQLLDVDVRQRMSSAARIKYEENHLAETMALRTAEVYEKLLDEQ